MWETVSNITSPLALAAFVIAVVLYMLRLYVDRTRRTIEIAPPEDRARLLEQAIGDYQISAEGLTKDQRFELVKRAMGERSRRFALSAKVVVVLSIVLAIIVLVAMTRNPSSEPAIKKAIPHPNSATTGEVGEGISRIDEIPFLTIEPKSRRMNDGFESLDHTTEFGRMWAQAIVTVAANDGVALPIEPLADAIDSSAASKTFNRIRQISRTYTTVGGANVQLTITYNDGPPSLDAMQQSIAKRKPLILIGSKSGNSFILLSLIYHWVKSPQLHEEVQAGLLFTGRPNDETARESTMFIAEVQRNILGYFTVECRRPSPIP